MKRSIRKGPFIKKKDCTVFKNSIITKYQFKKTFDVYNGKTFTEVEIHNLGMVGYKFGEFVSTKKFFTYKKKFQIMSFNITDFVVNLFKFNYISLDCPAEWQINFADSASPAMEGIVNFHNHIMVVICFIAFFVSWLLINCISYYSDSSISQSTKFTHSNGLEIVWTTIPALILLFLATPSFTLLYSMDELIEPVINFKIIGHQWYWSYELSDYTTCVSGNNNLKYSCYMMVLEGLPENKKGYFRLLETNRRILVPVKTHLRLYVTAADVLHSWTIPSFGLKVDACPGRLNLINLFIKRIGLFFGQCSEICGVNHGFMPISVMGVDVLQYNSYVMSKVNWVK